jgi:hypothetical protein
MNILSLKRSLICAIALLCIPFATSAALNPPVETFSDRTYAYWGQLVRCADNSAVYYIGPDAKRYVFPNDRTYMTYYPDFDDVRHVFCSDLARFPLGGVVTYNPGTRYVKFATDPTVYAVEPGGVLRAVPDERWMEVFVGADWNQHIDDVSDAFYPTYSFGEPLDLLEISDGMTARDPDTGVWYYFVDGQPKSLDGISFAFKKNGHFRNFTRTIDVAPEFYERAGPALRVGTRIESENEIKMGSPWFWEDTASWVNEDDFPRVVLSEEPVE